VKSGSIFLATGASGSTWAEAPPDPAQRLSRGRARAGAGAWGPQCHFINSWHRGTNLGH
jgi:hypothetical protein